SGAIADYTVALELDPQSAPAHFNRGLARKAKGDLRGAMADYAMALELDPKDVDARTNLASARSQVGEFCEDCRRGSTATSFPANVSSFNGIGRTFYGED